MPNKQRNEIISNKMQQKRDQRLIDLSKKKRLYTKNAKKIYEGIIVYYDSNRGDYDAYCLDWKGEMERNRHQWLERYLRTETDFTQDEQIDLLNLDLKARQRKYKITSEMIELLMKKSGGRHPDANFFTTPNSESLFKHHIKL